MLQGKVRAAVHWATEHARGDVLMPTESVEGSHEGDASVTVMDILHQKHPDLRPPKASSLAACDVLPLLEDVETTGLHILFVAHHVQGVLGLEAVMLATGGMFYFVLVAIVQDYVMLLLLLHEGC